MTGPATPSPVDASGCGFANARLWRLSPSQAAAVVATLVPRTVVDELADALTPTFVTELQGFTNRATGKQLPESHVSVLFSQARKIADRAVASLVMVHACLGTAAGPDDEACVSGFIDAFGKKAFRSPLAVDEKAAYLDFWKAQKPARGGKDAVAQVITAFLMSPRFLFRSELGTGDIKGVFKLTAHETAQALSFFIADGPPDAELMAAADKNLLGTKDQIVAQARRLASKPDTGRGVLRFLNESFDVALVNETSKDVAAFPKFDGKLLKDMATESEKFFEEVMFRGDGTINSLFTANYTVVTRGLANHYGVGAMVPAGATGFIKVPLPATQRGGFVTQGALMAGIAHPDNTDIVRRGEFVRERLLCQVLPPPPTNADVQPIPLTPSKQQRELLIAHSAKPECASCHSKMDPIGLTFENYDATGAWRTTEASRPIDASGTIEGVDGRAVKVANALELMKALAASGDVRQCLSSRMYEFAHGRKPGPLDACGTKVAAQAVEAKGGNLIEGLAAIVAEDSFVTRVR
jgi:hypothetical protein